MGLIIMSCVIVLFIVMGIIFSNGKGAFLIAGYNTMSKEEKEKYDSVALCKFMGKLMFALSFAMVFWLLAIIYSTNILFVVGFILFFIFLVFGLIYIGSSGKFQSKK
ncbi:DUF3784 domain-containing protein [Bacillus weihaiensis]|uniref:DUF3784 domain-containing protein n=1 Tax=Bacillus weihaiensis TaxID=1547283 RepID=A0A1L3MRD5_9BACI|nr:DUF3784 domain-containing protein [Bacillus weihaiensis]APH04929.1 hypothetical protein A9C19_09305 [Bacillus weihaiensis]